MFRCVFALLCAGLIAGSGALRAEDWPNWRGPRGDGSSLETGLPVKWSNSENVDWKVELPGSGHSSPVVSGDRIYLVSADIEETTSKAPDTAERSRTLVALNRTTGKLEWTKEVDRHPLEGKHKLNSWASSTPATDGRMIYVSFLSGREMLIAAFDWNGQEVWKVKPGIFSSVHGYCSSPVLFEETIIINGDHDGDAYLVALDKATGKTIWKTPRENRTRSYCTPIIRDIDGRTQMMLSGSKSVASFDPRTGKRQWVLDGPTEQFVASLVYADGLVFVTGGFPDKHIMAIDPRGSGNITGSEHIKWHHLRNGVSYVPSPVVANGCFFVVSDGGIATCFDTKTGKIEWQERLGGGHSASLVTGDGVVYFVNDDGHTRVVKAERKFELIADNDIGEHAYASLAINRSQLLIRGVDHLFCIGKVAAKE